MNDDTTHECPGPGCTARVPRDMLACRTHWFQVDKPTRDRVWAAYRSSDIADHVAAMDAAITQMRPL